MIPEAKSVGCRLLAIYAKKKRITIPHDCKMNAARASHPSRIKRGVPCRAPLPFAGVPRGFHSWLELREEACRLRSQVLMPATPAADESVLPCGTTLVKVSFECFTQVWANPTPWRNHPRRDCVSHPPRDACPKGSGQFHASSENTLPDVRARHKNDSGGCCAKAVGSGNMLWKSEEIWEEMVLAREWADISVRPFSISWCGPSRACRP